MPGVLTSTWAALGVKVLDLDSNGVVPVSSANQL